MKILRGIAYGMVLACAVLSIAILAYKGSENSKAAAIRAEMEAAENARMEANANAVVTVEGDEVGYDELISAASAIVSGVSMDIKTAIDNALSDISENNSGEIDYEEIVRLQTEQVEGMFKDVISDYNKKNGISVSSSTEKKAEEELTASYDYVVSKSTKTIHKTGCILEPLLDDAVYFSTIKDAKAAGYTDKCNVCSP